MNTDSPPNSSPTPCPAPVVQPSHGISVIWTLPLLALVICSWLLYQSIQNAGIEISIFFDNANGITEGKTQVIANGIPVGLIKKLDPDIQHKKVRAIVIMDKELEPQLVSDTLFWVVRPVLSAARIHGLETIFTGSYIGIQAGTSEKPQREFQGLPSAPPVSHEAPGLHLTLQAEALGSIQIGTGVYYKNIEIGTVQNYRLEGSKGILIDIYIEPDYADIVRVESRFCSASGLTISGKLTNLKVQFESFASLLRGGILLHTPEQLHDSAPAANGQLFPLYRDYEAANYGIPMTLQLASGVDIIEGVTKVMYRGIEAGFVKEIQINNDEHRTVTAHILLDPRAELILRKDTVFWIVKPTITPAGVRNLRTLVAGSHITFRPGDGEFSNHFRILPEPPPQEPLRPGTSLQLMSHNGVNLSAGAPLYYKNILVGEVVDVDLSPGSTTILTTVFLYEPYLNLVAPESVFWVQAGVEMTADISGIKLATGPLARLLHGGINFITPGIKENHRSQPAPDHIFTLHENYAKAVESTPTLQPPGIHFRLQTKHPQSLSVGAPILHRNIRIGRITGFSFSKDQQEVLIDCFIAQQYTDLITAATRFHTVSGLELSGGLDGVHLKMASLASVLAGGIACISDTDSPPLVPSVPLPLYNSIEEALHAGDTEISIRFTGISNLKIGSPMRYKGVVVGKVTKISFADDLEHIDVRIRVDDIVAPLFRTNTRIWQVQPELSLSGVSNIETAVLGSYITFLPGAGRPVRNFIALHEAPQNPFPKGEGLPLILETAHLGSLGVGAPVYYRQLKVGEVTGFELSPSFQKVYVFVMVAPQYVPVIRQNTRFWNVSGAQMAGGLFSGITVSTESLEAMLSGGIALATPDNEKVGSPVAAGYHFILHDRVEKQWLDWSPDIVLLEQEEQQQAQELPALKH